MKNSIKALVLLSTFALVSCSSIESQKQELKEREKAIELERETARISQEIESRGYAKVGETPDHKPLYMMYVHYGYRRYDRVYFSDTSIVSEQYCGKNCSVQVIKQP